MWNCGTGVKGIIVRVCKSVFCFVVQCQHSMGSGSVFPSVEQCFSVWSSVSQCGAVCGALSQGALGRSDAGRGLCPRPCATLPHSFCQTNCSPLFGYFGGTNLVHTFIKLLLCLLLKCTQVKYGSFGTRVLMGSVDVEGIWDDGDLRPSLTGAHSGHQGPVRSLLNSAAHQSARIAVCSKQKSEMLCSNQCLCWWDLIKIKPKNCKKAFSAARVRSREQLGSETLEFSVWKKLHHRIENYFWHIWQ